MLYVCMRFDGKQRVKFDQRYRKWRAICEKTARWESVQTFVELRLRYVVKMVLPRRRISVDPYLGITHSLDNFDKRSNKRHNQYLKVMI